MRTTIGLLFNKIIFIEKSLNRFPSNGIAKKKKNKKITESDEINL